MKDNQMFLQSGNENRGSCFLNLVYIFCCSATDVLVSILIIRKPSEVVMKWLICYPTFILEIMENCSKLIKSVVGWAFQILTRGTICWEVLILLYTDLCYF
jgi:hypothetical protein